MPYSESSFQYGPVIVIRGKLKGRVGYLDDETSHRGKLCGIVKFADPFVTPIYHIILLSYLDSPNTQNLLQRFDELFDAVSPFKGAELAADIRVGFLEEFAFVSSLLNERMFQAQFERNPRGASIFISHSSVDKEFVRGLAADLAARGHQPWLDEWEILAGESITEKVGAGIADADFLIVILSKAATQSRWVEQEWQAKHWLEVKERNVKVITVMKETCEIPMLLQTKKYVDLRGNKYSEGLELLLKSIGSLLERRSGA